MKRLASTLVLSAAIALMAVSSMPLYAQEAGSIKIWITGAENDATALGDAAAIFAEETGVEVTVEAVAWGDAYARYLTAVNSGEGADMFAGGMSWGISLGDLGGLVDLSQQFSDEYQAVLDQNNPEFIKSIIGMDGAVYGVPYNQDIFLMYYLIENLAQVDFEEPPATWEDFTDAVTQLEENGLGGAGIGWGNAGWMSFQNYLAQAGGAWYAEDCSAAAVNSEEGMMALEYFTSLYEDLDFPKESASTAGLSTGELSIVLEGEWAALGIDPSYPELVGKWAVAPLPAGPSNNAAFIGGKMIGIFSYSPNVDQSWEFIKWLQTSDAAQAIAEQYYNFAALHVPTQPDNYQFIQGDEQIRAALDAQLANTTGPANCPGWEESNAEVNLVLESVLFEGADFEDALIQLEDILNANLEMYGS